MILTVTLGSVFYMSALTLSPADLQHTLNTPIAQETAHFIAESTHAGFVPELQKRLQSPDLSPAAREWLTEKAIVRLQQSPRSDAGVIFLQSLTNHVSTVRLAQDFEGRIRELPLTQIASQAQRTLQWWEAQTLAKSLQSDATHYTLQDLLAQWPSLSPHQQQAWMLAVQSVDAPWQWSANDVDPNVFVQRAPALALWWAKQHRDIKLISAVLAAPSSDLTVRFAQTLPEWLDEYSLLHVIKQSMAQSPHRAVLYKHLASSRAPSAIPLVLSAAEEGEREAMFALGEAKPDLARSLYQKWFASNRVGRQKMAITGMRLLNDENSEHTLRKWAKQTDLATPLKVELSPWK